MHTYTVACRISTSVAFRQGYMYRPSALVAHASVALLWHTHFVLDYLLAECKTTIAPVLTQIDYTIVHALRLLQ